MLAVIYIHTCSVAREEYTEGGAMLPAAANWEKGGWFSAAWGEKVKGRESKWKEPVSEDECFIPKEQSDLAWFRWAAFQDPEFCMQCEFWAA